MKVLKGLHIAQISCPENFFDTVQKKKLKDKNKKRTVSHTGAINLIWVQKKYVYTFNLSLAYLLFTVNC